MMKYFVFSLLILTACSQDAYDFMQNPGANAKQECPIYKKGQLLPVAKITFDEQSLNLTAKDESILSEIVEMHYRCGGHVVIDGYRKATEASDYGLMRAAILSKELEKKGLSPRFMTFNPQAGEKTDAVISLQM